MDKVKVIQLLNCVGGLEVWLRLTINNINSDKIENIIIHGHEDTNNEFFDKKGRRIKEYKTTILRQISPINDLKAIYECIKIVRKEKPDFIHAHSAKGGVIGRIVGILTRTKVLFTPHAFSYLSEQNKLKRFIFLFIEKTLSTSNNVLIATSNSEKNRAINEVGYKKSKALIFNNSINPINISDALTIQKTWPDEYICTVGRPCFQKNIDFMIKVIYEIKKIKDIHLVVMGVGYHADQLEIVEKLIVELDLTQNVTLLNWTSREDVLQIIRNSKIYISTSRYEGLPYSIIEALALSKPCVVSNCDGNKDLIQDGYNGFVIDKLELQTFTEKILLLLENNSLLNEFSENAYKSFDENYNIDSNISILEKIYYSNSKKYNKTL